VFIAWCEWFVLLFEGKVWFESELHVLGGGSSCLCIKFWFFRFCLDFELIWLVGFVWFCGFLSTDC
jgi:hypothetical protein